MLRWLIACAGVSLASSSPVAAQPPAPKVRIAVVPGIAVNLDASRVDALSQDLAEALSGELVVDAIGGLEVRRRLPATGLPSDCVATKSCIADVAKRLDAQQLLFVVMVDTGGSLQIDSTWIDVATGTSASRPAIDIATLGEAKAKFVTGATQLLPDATVRPKPKAGLGGEMVPAVPRHVTMPAMITAGAAVVGLGVGLGFGLSARSSYKTCDRDRGACTDDDRASIRNRALIADVGWAVAIGGTIATAVLFATSSKESHLVVEPSPTGVALAAVGRF